MYILNGIFNAIVFITLMYELVKKLAKKNSLTEKEVSIIKALLALGRYQNQEIIGMINRSRGNASSDINSGRITNIKKNEIQKYIPIEPASNEAVSKFLLNYEKPEPSSIDKSPLSDYTLSQLFPFVAGWKTHFSITETDIIECKKSHVTPMKTVAAFANNRGGYFALGVENQTWKILGISDDKVNKFDFNKLNQAIRLSLGMEIKLSRRVIDYDRKKVVFIYVHEAHTKPVILIKGSSETSEGHIYYRYPGEDRLISPSDLQMIIEERIRKLSETILAKHLSNILSIGPENAAVMDLKSGKVEGQSGSFVIDQSLLSKISFVKEGEFNEQTGAPTLRLLGDIQPVNSTNIIVGRLANIRDEDLIEAFLKEDKVTTPMAYIERLKYTQRKWLPVYYFMSLAEFDKKQAISLLKDKGDGYPNSVQQQCLRIQNDIVPKPYGSVESYSIEIDLIKKERKIDFSCIETKEAKRYLSALRHLQAGEVSKKYLIQLLNDVYQRYYFEVEGKGAEFSLFLAAVCTVDALLYRNKG